MKQETLVILGTAHGANVAGKRSPDGRLREYRYSREICREIKRALDSRGVQCVIDVEDDNEPSLRWRVRRVNAIVRASGRRCVYVSVHVNAAGSGGVWRTASGFGVYVSPNGSADSRRLASLMGTMAVERRLTGNRAVPSCCYHVQNLAVCRDTVCPAVLTENFFQDNRADVDWLLSPEGRAAIVSLHVDSLMQYLTELRGGSTTVSGK